jgi:hypothetical protein
MRDLFIMAGGLIVGSGIGFTIGLIFDHYRKRSAPNPAPQKPLKPIVIRPEDNKLH